MTLARFLENKGYTENEVDETLIRLDCGMEIPEEVWKDIREYNKLDIKVPKIPEDRDSMYETYAEEIYWYVTEHYFEEWKESGLSIAEWVHSDFEIESEIYAFCLGY